MESILDFGTFANAKIVFCFAIGCHGYDRPMSTATGKSLNRSATRTPDAQVL